MKHNKLIGFSLIVLIISIAGCSIDAPFSNSTSEISFGPGSSAIKEEPARDKKSITFPVVLPDVATINNQEDVIPFLKTENNKKIPLPNNTPIYLRTGEQVDASYIGLRDYSVDVICDSFENETFNNVEKIIVNQTHEQVDPYKFYCAEVHSIGNSFYFTVDTNGQNKGLDGSYRLNMQWTHSYFYLLAGIPTRGTIQHIAIQYILSDADGNAAYVGEWDFGPILTQ